nr:hypothetical protein TgIa.1390c [Toxoplasma gondii RH]
MTYYVRIRQKNANLRTSMTFSSPAALQSRDSVMLAWCSRLRSNPCWKKLNKFPVQSFAWDEITDTLASISNSTVVCWLVPAAAFLSGDLLEESQITKETGDQNLGSQIVAFQNGYLTMQRPDAAMLQVAVAPFANAVFEQVAKLRW